MIDKTFQDGFDYSFDSSKCKECGGKCCIGESGYIWITQNEIIELSKFLNIDINELAQKYLRKISYKYSLKEIEYKDNNFACTFFDLEKKMCKIYDVRPKQCRTFPFWDYFKDKEEEVFKECIGVEKV